MAQKLYSTQVKQELDGVGIVFQKEIGLESMVENLEPLHIGILTQSLGLQDLQGWGSQ